MTTTDILIIGAGPTGMVLALELALQNTKNTSTNKPAVTFRIVDKYTSRAPNQSRALAVQPRTLELLRRYSPSALDAELVAPAAVPQGICLWVNHRPMDLYNGGNDNNDDDEKDSRFASGPLIISQAATEAFLERRLQECGVVVEHPVVVEALSQDEEGVDVVLAKDDGSKETVRCKYVVGCDGAHSIVRHAMNVSFPGAPYPQSFLLADTHCSWPDGGGKIHIMTHDSKLIVMMPLAEPGMMRIVVSQPPTAESKTSSSSSPPTLQDFKTALAEMLPTTPPDKRPQLTDAGGDEPRWLASFHLHHRCATQYRDGRLLIAGDAAHIHSPVGGQGMNTGIQDSVNLGWKLARSCSSSCSTSLLLDTYNEERRPVGQRLIDGTDRMFVALANPSWAVRWARDWVLPWVLPWGSGAGGRRRMRFLSQLDVRYRRSGIVRTGEGIRGDKTIRGGDRAVDGRLVGDGGDDDDDAWLLDLLGERAGEFTVFLFGAGEDNVDVNVQGIKEKLAAVGRTGVAVYLVVKEERGASCSASSSAGVVVAKGAALHRRYGFENKSGYVSVRPDGYVESIGHLDDDFDAFLAWTMKD